MRLLTGGSHPRPLERILVCITDVIGQCSRYEDGFEAILAESSSQYPGTGGGLWMLNYARIFWKTVSCWWKLPKTCSHSWWGWGQTSLELWCRPCLTCAGNEVWQLAQCWWGPLTENFSVGPLHWEGVFQTSYFCYQSSSSLLLVKVLVLSSSSSPAPRFLLLPSAQLLAGRVWKLGHRCWFRIFLLFRTLVLRELGFAHPFF